MCGWKRIVSLDTRPKEGDEGGQYGVAVSDSPAGILGRYRHLPFDISRTESSDLFGNTFYSEIDVVDANGPVPRMATVSNREPTLKSFTAEAGKHRFTLDATVAPDLAEWADTKLRPVVQEWYPKLVAMLPSEGVESATNITLRFRDDMGRTPASAGSGRVNLNSGWFRGELTREALGSVVHEMVHVVQKRKLNAASREGKYTEQLWKDCTGRTLQELGDQWRQEHEVRLAKGKTKPEDRDSDSK